MLTSGTNRVIAATIPMNTLGCKRDLVTNDRLKK